MAKRTSVKRALKNAADNPVPTTDVMLDLPAHYLVCRTLFHTANNTDYDQRGAMSRASTAQKMILDRMAGLRKAGSHPAARVDTGIKFADLTMGFLEEGESDGDGVGSTEVPENDS